MKMGGVLSQIHGIKAKKLQYEDLASSFAFQHCNGIVQIPTPKYKETTQTIEVVLLFSLR